MDKAIHSEGQAVMCALLRETRVAAGLTQQQVARELGVPQSFVSKYESGERRLDIIELRQVARVIGSSLSGLVYDLERRLPNQ